MFELPIYCPVQEVQQGPLKDPHTYGGPVVKEEDP